MRIIGTNRRENSLRCFFIQDFSRFPSPYAAVYDQYIINRPWQVYRKRESLSASKSILIKTLILLLPFHVYLFESCVFNQLVFSLFGD